MVARPGQIAAIRKFNRFYTREIGLLDEGLAGSSFSLTEARVLFELARVEQLAASDLSRGLGLDPGYLSRILKRFEARGLIKRVASEQDGRRAVLTITDVGRAAFRPLEQASSDEVARLLERVPAASRAELVKSLSRAEQLLAAGQASSQSPTLRQLQVGDIGWITHRQGMLYAKEHGWELSYEALVADILAGFVRNFDEEQEASWIAEVGGEIVGSVFVVRQSGNIAKLRLLYVEPSARGSGLGRKLVAECISFARERGYRTLTLWTNDVLTSARRIYEAAGFQLVSEERHHAFGKDLVGQNWELALG